MHRVDLDVSPRDGAAVGSRGALRSLREGGAIPGVLYGHGAPAVVSIDAKAFSRAIHTQAGVNVLINLTLGGESTVAMVKEIQRDVFTRAPIHVDLQRIDMQQKQEFIVPVHTAGEAPGVKTQGGILEFIQREVRIRCLPGDVPGAIDVDISKLEIHHSVKVQDLPGLPGVEILTLGDHILVNVVAPKVEEAPAPEAVAGVAGAEAQPEVITKGKKDEEGAAAGPAAAAGDKKPAEKKKA